MSEGITIVVKGLDGTGRTIIAEQIKHMLIAKGFDNVTSVDNGGRVDLSDNNIRHQPITIVESGAPER